MSFLLIGLAGANLSATAQAPAPAPAKPGSRPVDQDYTSEVTVRLAEIRALVTDKNNRPIEGLRPDEVEIKEDGAVRKIAFVESLATRDLAARVLPQAAPLVTGKGEKLPPEIAKPIPTPKPQRRIVLLFDAFNSRTQDRHRWVAAARGWAEKSLQPDDLVSIAVLEKSGINVLQNFTGDHNVLLQTLSSESFLPPGEYHDWAADITSAAGNLSTCDNAAANIAECSILALTPIVNEWEGRTQITIETLRQYIATLASIPGRKAVLFIGNGIVANPADVAADVILAKWGTDRINYSSARMMFQSRYEGALLDLTRVATTADVTFFTFDTRSSARRDLANDVDQSVISSFQRASDPFAEIFDMTRASMDTVAQRTGGRGLHGPRIEENLPAAASAVGGIYTIGYYRDATLEGVPKIKLKVARKGAVVTFVDRYDPLRKTPQVVPLELGIGKPQPVQDGIQLPVTIQLPLGDLAFTQDEKTWKTEMGVYAEAIAPDGTRAASTFESVVLSVPQQQYDERVGRKFTFTVTLLVRAGAYRVRARMSDAAFRHAAERAVDVTIRPDFSLVPGIQESVQNQTSGQLAPSTDTVRPIIPPTK